MKEGSKIHCQMSQIIKGFKYWNCHIKKGWKHQNCFFLNTWHGNWHFSHPNLHHCRDRCNIKISLYVENGVSRHFLTDTPDIESCYYSTGEAFLDAMMQTRTFSLYFFCRPEPNQTLDKRVENNFILTANNIAIHRSIQSQNFQGCQSLWSGVWL